MEINYIAFAFLERSDGSALDINTTDLVLLYGCRSQLGELRMLRT